MIKTDQQIWLVRHGETAWSLTGQHTGRTDIPLLPDSEPRLKALEPHLREHPFAMVLTSPLVRASRTAELIGFPSAERDPNLKEWNYGDYDGKTKDDIRLLVPDWAIWTHGVPHGERIEDVAARAQKVIDRAREIPGNVLLVAHGHILRILATCWLEIPPINAEHFALSTGSISVLAYENDLPVLSRWNWQPDPL